MEEREIVYNSNAAFTTGHEKDKDEQKASE